MNNPTIILAVITIVVKRMVSSFDGQTTFLSSSLTSRKKLVFILFIKKTSHPRGMQTQLYLILYLFSRHVILRNMSRGLTARSFY